MNVFGQAFSEALNAQVQEGSTAFLPDERESQFRGNIGWATAQNRYRIYLPDSIDGYELAVTMQKDEAGIELNKGSVEFNGKIYPLTTTMAGGAFVIMDDLNESGYFRGYITERDGVAWVFNERVLSFPVNKMVYWGSEKFRDIITERGEPLQSVAGLIGMGNWKRSFRNFVAMHLLYLPAAVAAVAKWGQRNNVTEQKVDIDSVWSLNPLWSSAQFTEDGDMFFTPEAQREIVGDDDGFTESTMFQQRAALWKLLGEDNPLAYIPDQKTGKYAVKSPALNAAINMVMGDWKDEKLFAISNVPLPLHDVIDGQGRPIRQDVIVEWFSTEEEAKEFVVQADGLTVDPSQGKELPDAWVGLLREWQNAIKDLQSRFDTPDEVDKDTLDLLEATTEQISAWW